MTDSQPADETAMHPSVAHVYQFFAFEHLPEHLQRVSQPFKALARSIALRKLLEAKDAAVRAALT